MTLGPEPGILHPVDDRVGHRIDEVGPEEDVVEDEGGASQVLVEVGVHDAGGDEGKVGQEAEEEDHRHGHGDHRRLPALQPLHHRLLLTSGNGAGDDAVAVEFLCLRVFAVGCL